mmetsp:Transcript_34735/g.81092  ORF Transcript_34735/g.81092 Transcript_34735/m.81092 type:complete len:178 (+) Transcript_34735:2760-3293(+)
MVDWSRGSPAMPPMTAEVRGVRRGAWLAEAVAGYPLEPTLMAHAGPFGRSAALLFAGPRLADEEFRVLVLEARSVRKVRLMSRSGDLDGEYALSTGVPGAVNSAPLPSAPMAVARGTYPVVLVPVVNADEALLSLASRTVTRGLNFGDLWSSGRFGTAGTETRIAGALREVRGDVLT